MEGRRASDSSYEVVETTEFQYLVRNALGDVVRWYEARWSRSVRWVLNRAPQQGNHLPHLDLWALMLRTRPLIAVYYRIDESLKRVTLLDVKALEA